MCSLFPVLSQLQFMPMQEIPSPMKKYRNRCLTLLEVPVGARGLFDLQRKAKPRLAASGPGYTLGDRRGQTAGQRQHLPRGQTFEPVVAPHLSPPS